MNVQIKLYDVQKVKEQDYAGLTLDFLLAEREVRDIFSTVWLELNAFDYISYDSVKGDFQYCKVFLDSELLYSGSILDVNELQCKIKHLTRVDTKNDSL